MGAGMCSPMGDPWGTSAGHKLDQWMEMGTSLMASCREKLASALQGGPKPVALSVQASWAMLGVDLGPPLSLERSHGAHAGN